MVYWNWTYTCLRGLAFRLLAVVVVLGWRNLTCIGRNNFLVTYFHHVSYFFFQTEAKSANIYFSKTEEIGNDQQVCVLFKDFTVEKWTSLGKLQPLGRNVDIQFHKATAFLNYSYLCYGDIHTNSSFWLLSHLIFGPLLLMFFKLSSLVCMKIGF